MLTHALKTFKNVLLPNALSICILIYCLKKNHLVKRLKAIFSCRNEFLTKMSKLIPFNEHSYNLRNFSFK